MTLKAKLTLGSVVLAAGIVAAVSAVNLGNLLEFQFRSMLERAESIKILATETVMIAVNQSRPLPAEEALSDPELQNKLLKLLTQTRFVLGIAVVAEGDHRILASTLGEARVGTTAPFIPDFEPLVTRAGWLRKFNVAMKKSAEHYRIEKAMGTGSVTLFRVQVVIDPTLIHEDLVPALTRSATIAAISVLAAALLTLALSAVAFRTLGQIGSMLDLVARDEFDAGKLLPGKEATDELSVIAKKVSLLGQRLRGAQFEASDLRGNIDHLLHDLEDGVFLFNRDLRLVFASGAVERFMGDGWKDMPGRAMADVFPTGATLGLLIEQAAQAGRSLRNRRVPVGTGNEVVLVSVDVLEGGVLVRLRDPEAQRKLGRELHTADRLLAISKVTSGVAHEVKNPLNAMLLHVEVARAKLKAGDTGIGPQMEIIAKEIVRLDRVVRMFLDFTRPVELHLANVPLAELVGEIVDLARPQALNGNIEVKMGPAVSGVDVRVDRDLLKQAVLNVVVNAMQAMGEGGTLTFASSVEKEMAEIRISDTGPGIPPEVRDRIFRLYYTTKKEGSGIGLAMTFRIVQLHDGTIDFISETGKGTTFLIRLPLAEPV